MFVMDLHALMYIIYIVLSIGLTWWVGRTLFRNGQVFLNEVFGQDTGLAESVNRLLLMGFYLLNLGFMVYVLTVEAEIGAPRELMEILSRQMGKIILCLGTLHFINLYVFFTLRRRHRYSAPPLPPLE